jgi:hypothetical protein
MKSATCKELLLRTTASPKHTEKRFSQEMIDLLDSEARRPVSKSCPLCGSQLESREVTLSYHERTWEIHLTSCVICNPS